MCEILYIRGQEAAPLRRREEELAKREFDLKAHLQGLVWEKRHLGFPRYKFANQRG